MEDFMKVQRDLAEYASVEGSEIGELCNTLDLLFGYRSYFISKNMERVLRQEIKAQLKNFRDHARIVEREQTYTHTIRELEWY